MSPPPNDLRQKIRDAQERQRKYDPSPEPSQKGSMSGAGAALRVATDLVAALAVGGFIGYWLDEWLGTRPLFMIILFFIGFAAGFLNIYRAQVGTPFKIGFRPEQHAPHDNNPSAADAAGNDTKEKE